jgi:hypothetical protein
MNWIKRLFNKEQKIEQTIDYISVLRVDHDGEPNIIWTSHIKYKFEFLPGKTIIVDKDEEHISKINFNKGYWFFAVNEVFRDKKRYGVYKLTKKEFYWIRNKVENNAGAFLDYEKGR